MRQGASGPRVQSLGSSAIEIDLDDARYLGAGDVAAYVKRRLLAEEEPKRRTPYRNEPELAGLVSEAVAKRAGTVFLIARIESLETCSRLTPPSPSVIPDGRSSFRRRCTMPSMSSSTVLTELDKVDLDKRKVRELLMPLAYAEGQGLPWENIWAPLANSISGEAYKDGDVRLVLDHAGAYIIETLEHERSVYRLYHQALAEYLRDESRTSEIQRRITQTLTALTPELGPGQGRDWPRAHPYTRAYLATHAAAAGQLDALLVDSFFLVAAERAPLVRVLDRASTESARMAARVYALASHHLERELPGERASYLELIARQSGADELASCVSDLPLLRPFTVPWARWAPPASHRAVGRHEGGVPSLALGALNDRPVIVSGGGDGTVRVWDLADGAQIGEALRGSEREISAVAISALKGRPMLVSGGFDGMVRVWDLENRRPIGKPLRHVGEICALAVGELEGHPIIVCGGSVDGIIGMVQVWRLGDGAPIGEAFKGDEEEVRALVVGELDGYPVLVSGGLDGIVRTWDLAKGTLIRERRCEHEGGVRALAIGALEERPVIVSAGGDNMLRVWDATDAKSLWRAHAYLPKAIAVGELDERSVIVSGGGDRLLRVWNLPDGAPIGEPLGGHVSGISAVAVGEVKGQLVIVSSSFLEEGVRVWKWRDSPPVESALDEHALGISAIAAGALEGRPVLVSGDSNGLIRVWGLTDGKPLGRQFKADEYWIRALAIGTLAGRPVVVSGGDFSVRVWDLADGKAIGDPLGAGEHVIRAIGVCALKERLVIVAADAGGTVRVWDLADRTPIPELTDVGVGVSDGWVSVAAAGELEGRPVIVCGNPDGTVRIWDLANRRPLVEPLRLTRKIDALAVGELQGRPAIISGDVNGTVRVWDVHGVLRRKIDLGPWVEAIALVPPSTLVASSHDGLVMLGLLSSCRHDCSPHAGPH